MNTQVSPSFSGVKWFFALSVTTIVVVLVSAKFVHASHPPVPATVAVAVAAAEIAPTTDVATAQPSADAVERGTPASLSYHDGINVAAISVAAYDH